MGTVVHVGRIGGLAIGLGVGAGIALGLPAVAEAAPADPSPGPAAASAAPHADTRARAHAARATETEARQAHRRQLHTVRSTARSVAAASDPVTGVFGQLAATLFNQTPTVRVRQSQGPGGVVSGDVSTFDPDSDAVTVTVTGHPTHGSVVVNADATFTYTADPSVGPTGTTDSFTVTVSDAGSGFHLHGIGGLINLLTFGLIGDPGHTVNTTVAMTIAPFADPPAAEALSTFCGCTLMPANTVFHADVSALPVLAKSDAWTSLLGGNLSAVWGGEPWMNNTAGMPVNTVSATQPTETVIFNRGLTTSGPSIDDRPYAIPDRPLVEGMPNVPAWDRHLLVFQEGTCISQELYNVANGVELPASGVGDALANAIYASQFGSSWLAEAGVHYDMGSASYPVTGQANASQLPYLPLILRPDDLTRGSIDHMLGIVIAKDKGTGYAWPARSGDGTGTNPDGVPMGTVFRLRSDFDISGYDATTRIVLRALQEHGAVVYDSFGPGQEGARLMAMSNGWTTTAFLTAQRELSTIPISEFEAVDVLGLAIDPNAGWTIRT